MLPGTFSGSVPLAVPSGEAAKSMQVYGTLLHQLASQEAHRDDVVVGLGGGTVGDLAGFEFFESNSLFSHTAGTWAAAVTVNGANQSGTQLTITAGVGTTFNAGDKISIAGVNRVNR